MKNLNLLTIKGSISNLGALLLAFVGRYKTILTLLITSGAILFAVLQAQGFLNPVRNEEKYIEIKSQVNVKSIDQEILQKLEKTQADRTNSADSNFVPGRDNPFSE